MKQLYLLLLSAFIYSNSQSQIPVNRSYSTMIGGIPQWVEIRGKDISKPLLLWLHGGPGGSALPYAETISKKLRADFVVVHWDQRATGETDQLSKTGEPKLEQMNNDVNEMIAYLLREFKKEKLFLAGNSWGGYLAIQAAGKHPELLEACILISPSIYGDESEMMSLQYVRQQAENKKDSIAIKEIATIKVPFKEASDLWLLRKWLFTFHGLNPSRALLPEKKFMPIAEKWFRVIVDFEHFNPFTEIQEIKCPLFFLIGKYDFITHPQIAERFYEHVKAPVKQFYWFDAGHMVTTEQPDKMQRVIMKDIPAALQNN